MFTPTELAAAACVQATIDRKTELSDLPGFMDPDSGYPAGAAYFERTKLFHAVEETTLAALGVSSKDAGDIRFRIAFQFQGTRAERVSVMGEAWVKNQEDRGLVPLPPHDVPCVCSDTDRCRAVRRADAAAQPTQVAALRALHRAHND